MSLLDRDTIERALIALDAKLAERGCEAEIILVGGAVMCLVHHARPATRDVDAWFSEPRQVGSAAREVGEEMGLDEDWLNDAAIAFLPANAGYETYRKFDHLNVSAVDPKTLLAMKCAASRTGVGVADIRFLVSHLKLVSAAAVLDVVIHYYPEERLPVRTRLLIEELFDERG